MTECGALDCLKGEGARDEGGPGLEIPTRSHSGANLFSTGRLHFHHVPTRF